MNVTKAPSRRYTGGVPHPSSQLQWQTISRPVEAVTAVPPWIGIEVPLVVLLRGPVRSRGIHGRDHRRRATKRLFELLGQCVVPRAITTVQALNHKLSRVALPFGVIEDGGAVLRADIAVLPVQRGRVVHAEEKLQERVVG